MSNRLEREAELRRIASRQLPDMVITVALLEHQVDLIGRIVLDAVDLDVLPEETVKLVDNLKALMAHSSVNFDEMEINPLESYKIPEAVMNKARTRMVQERYLQSKIREGLI